MTKLDLRSDEKMMKWKREKELKKWKKRIDNKIGTEGAKTISESLKINPSLALLNLKGDEKDKKWKRENKMKRNEKRNE